MNSYRSYELTGLLVDLRDVLEPELADRVKREAPGMSNAEADRVINTLREMADELVGPTHAFNGAAPLPARHLRLVK